MLELARLCISVHPGPGVVVGLVVRPSGSSVAGMGPRMVKGRGALDHPPPPCPLRARPKVPGREGWCHVGVSCGGPRGDRGGRGRAGGHHHAYASAAGPPPAGRVVGVPGFGGDGPVSPVPVDHSARTVPRSSAGDRFGFDHLMRVAAGGARGRSSRSGARRRSPGPPFTPRSPPAWGGGLDRSAGNLRREHP